MHQLILLRHAKAVRASVELADHDRGLAVDGRAAAAAMGAMMRRIGLTPDVILVSSSLRTQETLDALEPWDDRPNIEPLSSLYMASHQQIRDLLRELPETVRSALVIAHNPGIHELAQLLAGEAGVDPGKPELARLAEGYPTAAVTEFLIATPWRKLAVTPPAASSATLIRFILPADLPLAPR